MARWSNERVSDEDIENNCSANVQEMTCTFTNDSTHAKRACYRGEVSAKDGSGAINSMPICVSIRPYESRNVSVLWSSSEALRKLCADPAGGFNWANCSFEVDRRKP